MVPRAPVKNGFTAAVDLQIDEVDRSHWFIFMRIRFVGPCNSRGVHTVLIRRVEVEVEVAGDDQEEFMSTQDTDPSKPIPLLGEQNAAEEESAAPPPTPPPLQATKASEPPRGPRSAQDAAQKTDELLGTYQPHPNCKALQERDWRAEVFYFLLPDRFNAHYGFDMMTCPPELQRWDLWAISGRNRFQGGNIAGIIDKLTYLSELGVTALWVGPVWKQRAAGLNRNVGRSQGTVDDPLPTPLPQTFFDVNKSSSTNGTDDYETVRASLGPSDDYHGYAIMDFLDVDPRFGSAEDLRQLVAEAHTAGMRVILDIVINHSGENWLYDWVPALDPLRPPYLEEPAAGRVAPIGDRYEFGRFLDADNHPLPPLEAGQHLSEENRNDGVWPTELQNPEMYNRRGFHNYGGDDDFKANDPFRLADWMNRDFRYDELADSPMLKVMLQIWKYWIVLTDCDGFRVDTFKHVPIEVSQSFTRQIREFVRHLGKDDFFMVGEVGGGDQEGADYLARDPENLRVLEVGERRDQLRKIAVGDLGDADARYVLMPTKGNISARTLSDRVMTSIDDHDNLGTTLQRFARTPRNNDVEASANPAALVPALGLLLFGPGIPCLYYGTEQALTGPIGPAAHEWLKAADWGIGSNNQAGDRYLREAMFAPQHPRLPGLAGLRPGLAGFDLAMPGFTPDGPGKPERFDEGSDTFKVAKELIAARKKNQQLWNGDVEVCAVSQQFTPFNLAPGNVVAWTRTTTDDAGKFVAGALIVVDTRPAGAAERFTIQLPPQYSNVRTLKHAVTQTGHTPAITRRSLRTTSGLQTNLVRVQVSTYPHSVSVFLA